MAGKDILIVDDDPDDLGLLCRILEGEGYKVRGTLSGEEAVEAAQALAPDLVLLDIGLPEMDGYQVCKELKDDVTTRDIPVIFITGWTDIEEKVEGFKAGGVDYITKPFFKEEILARVRAHTALRDSYETAGREDGSTTLAAVVAHKLKNPAFFLVGNVILLKQSIEQLPEQLREDLLEQLDGIAANAERISHIAESFLQLECRVVPSLQTRDLAEMLPAIVSAMVTDRNQYGLQIEFETNGPCLVELDEELFAQIVGELLQNALQAMPEGGDIHIKCAGPFAPNTAPMAGFPRPHYLVSLSDSGPGISEQVKDRVFEEGVTTRAQGSGLGLAIVRKNARQMACEVIEDGPDERTAGARFRIAVPSRDSV